MIRDPSDGTVKEINLQANEINSVAVKNRSKGITSGLAEVGIPTTKEIERLNESRDWLKQYFKKEQ